MTTLKRKFPSLSTRDREVLGENLRNRLYLNKRGKPYFIDPTVARPNIAIVSRLVQHGLLVKHKPPTDTVLWYYDITPEGIEALGA